VIFSSMEANDDSYAGDEAETAFSPSFHPLLKRHHRFGTSGREGLQGCGSTVNLGKRGIGVFHIRRRHMPRGCEMPINHGFDDTT